VFGDCSIVEVAQYTNDLKSSLEVLSKRAR
jgi:hypothetical protein